MNNWRIYKGEGRPHPGIDNLPSPPKWRRFEGKIIEDRQFETDPHIVRRFGDVARGKTFVTDDNEIDRVNAALYLRRPLLITGKPGTGKSSLAYAVAYELQLGPVLRWSINSRSSLQEGLYRYDAIGRLQEAQLEKGIPDIGKYIRLGPLGTAMLPSKKPRVLLIDEIDKSDIDLPNDLLGIFEEGEFDIPELTRMADTAEKVRILPYDGKDKVTVVKGQVNCHAFPIVVLTSNGERELPPPFLRRCIRLDIHEPTPEKLRDIIESHFTDISEKHREERDNLIDTFLERRNEGDLATDQLLNAIYLTLQNIDLKSVGGDKESLINTVLRHLNTM